MNNEPDGGGIAPIIPARIHSQKGIIAVTPVQTTTYMVVVWGGGERLSDDPAVRLHFDTLDDARLALDTHRASRRYRSGMLMQWDKQSGNWTLVAQFS